MKTKKWTIKQLCLLIAIVLISTFVVGGTLAYIATKTDRLVNTFKPASVKTDIEEPGWKDGNTVKENVTIKNTGDVDAFIRAAIVVTWQDKQGNVYSATPSIDTDYTLTMGAKWFKSGNYYYYPSVVKANTEIEEKLIVKCEPIANRAPEGYTLSVEIMSSAIQIEPAEAVENAWKVDVNVDDKGNATISK